MLPLTVSISVVVFVTTALVPTACVPLKDELDISELESQQVSLRSDMMPLQRAIISSADVLTQPLQFRQKEARKPRRRNLKLSKLLRKMGPDFMSEWMSIESPQGAPSKEQQQMGPGQIEELVRQVQDLNLEQELEELVGEGPPELGDNLVRNYNDDDYEEVISSEAAKRMKTRMIAVFQEWLIQKSSCPVTYEWRDLGDYFWPRWIRQGHCDDEVRADGDDHVKSESSGVDVGCSWPKGMLCVPGQTKILHILRWHCGSRRRKKTNGNGGSKHRCRWYKVPFPVTSNCKCACK